MTTSDGILSGAFWRPAIARAIVMFLQVIGTVLIAVAVHLLDMNWRRILGFGAVAAVASLAVSVIVFLLRLDRPADPLE